MHLDAAAQEQRAADDLRQAGAGEASRAAQQRANEHRDAARCRDVLECGVDVVGELLGALLLGGTRR